MPGLDDSAQSPEESWLAAPELRPLPLGTLRPEGWLLERLRQQADGMAGHLDEFWPDVARSGWIGGDAEGWERGPYWLDGIVGIAYLLDDERLKAKVDHWVGYILEHQHPDGWFGPRSGEATYADHDVWPRIIVLKALLQHFDATGDPRVIPASLRFCELLDGLLDEWPLREWARSRWTDVVWVIHQLHDLTSEDWLLPLAAKCQAQGFDWFAYADRLPFTEKEPEATLLAYQEEAGGTWMNDGHLSSHGVNVAMGLKAMPVWWRIGGEEPHATWEVHPASPWNYALAIDPHDVPQYVDLDRQSVGDRPFSPATAPIQLRVRGRRIPWALEHGAAAAPPLGPVESAEELEELVLIPYGCTTLRVTELPWTVT